MKLINNSHLSPKAFSQELPARKKAGGALVPVGISSGMWAQCSRGHSHFGVNLKAAQAQASGQTCSHSSAQRPAVEGMAKPPHSLCCGGVPVLRGGLGPAQASQGK